MLYWLFRTGITKYSRMQTIAVRPHAAVTGFEVSVACVTKWATHTNHATIQTADHSGDNIAAKVSATNAVILSNARIENRGFIAPADRWSNDVSRQFTSERQLMAAEFAGVDSQFPQ